MGTNSYVNTAIFGLGYFLLILFWFYILPAININITLLETVLVSMGYVGFSIYMVITERKVDLKRFFYVLIAFFFAKLFLPILLNMPSVQSYYGSNLEIIESLFYVFLLIGGMIWASDILGEKQELETQQLTKVGW